MRTLVPPRTTLGAIARGSVIPGVGTVESVHPLISRVDRLRGRFHRNSAAYLLVTTGGHSFKCAVFRQATTAVAATAELVRRFEAGGHSDAVPAVRYADELCLIAEYLPGRVLSPVSLTGERASELGHFIATRQLSADPQKDIPYRRLLEHTLASPGIDPNLQKQLGQALSRAGGLDDTPWGVCFFDSALKNYVESPQGDFSYIDLFGIALRPLGTSLVRQALAVPSGHREAFLDGWFSATGQGSRIRDGLPGYCLHHLIYRLCHQADHPEKSVHRTGMRRRKRRQAFLVAATELQRCLDLPHDPESFYRWILSVR
ncbi:hypothetical protein SAMN05920897_10725 [Alkalispirochaeta americana]|uniref:Aminoglycoside phosphotransferase domain-containing protein n=1 Tax=Alkalispirochaeta americana TaxID=159291 RepID=A0A1N6RUN1_9SPIO|nr:hypothetical protein [Alkalispirochaeta americana]SIQ32528.1 hypothetical protein SAMN05920897_10725 [Alkalispirochaeta americana]